jgi:uncharacterized repeat protein (TIGR03803 family)
VIGTNGALYDTTPGTVFELTPPTSSGGAWIESVLYSFMGGTDGTASEASMAIGSGGVLYGTTMMGGNRGCSFSEGCGTVYSLTPPTSPGGYWTETVLHRFSGSDGASPLAGVVVGKNGVLYGTTASGGPGGGGTVFALAPPQSPGGAWTENVLHSFVGNGGYQQSGGAGPMTSVVIGKNGALYGTTNAGGIAEAWCYEGCGTVFELERPVSPGDAWAENVLHSFTGVNDGLTPSGLIAKNGVLYGTTYYGGNDPVLGGGTVFELTPPTSSGGAWTESVLYEFTGGSGGKIPNAVVLISKDGRLYGTTAGGGTGSCSCGTVFSLTPPASPGGAWTETVLHSFTGGSDGSDPLTGMVVGSVGVLYGATSGGGTSGYGTVFALKP